MADNRVALLIASSEYDDASFRSLKAPGHDVKELSRVLSDPAIGGFGSVKTLLNRPKDELVFEIEEFFDERNRADLLLLYFSCHGIKDKDGRLYYAAKNTRQNRLVATAVAAYEVNDLLLKSASRRKILILDCCYSGAFSKAFLAKGATEVGSMEVFNQGQGLVTLTASDAFQLSLEEEGLGDAEVCSVFTRALVDGIETGKADRDGDQLISLDELYDYAFEYVRNVNPNQSPRIQGDVEGKIIVARNPQPPRPVDLPPGLLSNMDNPSAVVKLAVVEELGKLLKDRNAGLALSARAALFTMAGNDSRKVASAAEQLLNAAQPEATPADAEEQAGKRREQAITKGRNDAAALFRSGDFQGAVALLDTLIEQYPNSSDTRRDRDAAVGALAMQLQEAKARAEERAERDRQEQAITKGRNDAAALFRSGNFDGAVALLDALVKQYPDRSDTRRDREAAASALATQQRQEEEALAAKQAEKRARRKAEEDARKLQTQAIDTWRNGAATLFKSGNFQGAVDILDALLKQYPDSAEARRDRAAAASALATQQQEARTRAEQQAQERARTETERQTILEGRNHAAALLSQEDFPGAIAILDRLLEQFSTSIDIRNDREAAANAFARQLEARNRMRAPGPKPDPGAPPVPGTSYATFGSRLLAYIIDFFVVCCFCVPLSLGEFRNNMSSDGATTFLGFLFLVFDWIYQTKTIGSRRQSTWGMRVAGIFVCGEKGEPLSYLRVTGRQVAKFFFMLGVFIQPFTQKKQALHDLIAKSLVLRRSA